MRIVCSICLEDVHENSCLTAIVRCGHIFDKACIDQALKNGRGQCPVCKSQVVNSSSFTPHYFRIYPSASESHDNQECINLKAKLAEANLRIATLSLEVSDTKNALNSSHQEQKTLSSKLKEANATAERTTKVTERLKEDIERIKRAKDDCHKRADKLKYLNQTLTSNLKESENLCQSLREQLVIQDVSSDSQGALNSVPSISGSLPLTQASQKDYLDLKKSYQELVIRERLATKKLADLAIQGKDSEDIENLANTQRVYKQLNEALTKLLKTTNNANQLKHEKKDILNEKKALQEKYNAANVDLKRLQLAEKIWTQNTSHLQDIIKRMSEDLFKLETLNQDCATDNNKLKERIKSLTESLAVSKKDYGILKRKGEGEVVGLQRIIVELKKVVMEHQERIKKLDEQMIKDSRHYISQLESLAAIRRSLDQENERLLRELKAARQPWFSFK